MIRDQVAGSLQITTMQPKLGNDDEEASTPRMDEASPMLGARRPRLHLVLPAICAMGALGAVARRATTTAGLYGQASAQPCTEVEKLEISKYTITSSSAPEDGKWADSLMGCAFRNVTDTHGCSELGKTSCVGSSLAFGLHFVSNEQTPTGPLTVKDWDKDIYGTNHDALAQDLYGPSHKLVSASLAQRMYDESSLTGYGLATFNLTRLTPHDVAMGHLGATYGYQSVVAYVPKVELAVAVGTNIERDEQDQPADVFCHVYNTAAAILQGLPVPTCTYSRGYWSGGCKCH